MSKLLRVKQAADYLGVTPQTIRNWSNSWELPNSYNGAGQRLYETKDLDNYKNKRMGIPIEETPTIKIFYTRTSNKQDISLKNQEQKLIEAYGNPDKTYKDTSSGLNDNRKGLNNLIKYTKENPNTKKEIYITNKDRLTRFGYHYLEELFNNNNTTITILDCDETKEPLEILMQDFMSLLASFSGKFYRLRGWEQRKKFLEKVQEEVKNHVK